jgi:hypothetical protein
MAESNSYCFEKSVSLKQVRESIEFLLLPNDEAVLNTEQNCIEINVSPSRAKLFEKYFSEKNNLRLGQKEVREESDGIEKKECRLDLKNSTKMLQEENNLKLGIKNQINKSEKLNSSVSTLELLLGSGIPGEIQVGSEALKVVCTKSNDDAANLVFTFKDITKASVRSEVVLKKGEWLNIASVIKDLNEKNNTLSLPQTEIRELKGKTETIYELQFK